MGTRARRLQGPGHRRQESKHQPARAEPPEAPDGHRWRRIAQLTGLIILVAGAVLLVHWPVLSAQALSFDDHSYIVDNPLVRNPSWRMAWRFLAEVFEPSEIKGYYHPLTHISLMLDYGAGGRPEDLMPFHRTGLLLHVINTSLVMVLVHLLFRRVLIGALVGLLFGLHPLSVEPVAWVSSRKGILAASFALWSLVFYAAYVRSNAGSYRWLSAGAYALALLSKPTSVPLPAVLLLLDYWPLRRLNLRSVWEKWPFFVLGGLSAGITVASHVRTAAVELPAEYGLASMPLIACCKMVFFLRSTFWPAGLSPYYPYPSPVSLANPLILVGVVGSCAVVAVALLSLRRTRALLASWLMFLILVAPMLGFVRYGAEWVFAFDNYLYLPLAAWALALAALLCWIQDSLRVGSPALRKTGVVLLVLLLAGTEAVGTRRYLGHWRDSVTLAERTKSLTPEDAQVRVNLGSALSEEGRFAEAIEQLRYALKLQPDMPDAHYNLGHALASLGRHEEALVHFQHVVQIERDNAKAHNNLGAALRHLGRDDEAIDQFRRAVEIKPDHASALNNLGKALFARGEVEEAVRHLRRAVEIRPDLADARYDLGCAVHRAGQGTEARAQFAEAARLRPDEPKFLASLAYLLATDPDATPSDREEAVRLAQRAAQLTNRRNAVVLDALAVAYAAVGQFDQAVTTAQAGLAVALNTRQTGAVSRIRKHLELFQQGKALQEPAQSPAPQP